MNEKFYVSKIDVAQRQLNLAIRLLFKDADPVAVHTLVGAASTIFSNLIEHHAPDKSWDKLAQEANKLSASEYFNIMRKTQNFFKHARDDHDSVLEFSPKDTESLAFWTIMNCSELLPMSPETQVFQLWYIASHWPLEDKDETPFKEATQLFGDLREVPRKIRLNLGAAVLNDFQPTNA